LETYARQAVSYSTSAPASVLTAPRTISRLLDFKPSGAVDDVKVDGYVRSIRSFKHHHFVSLGDGSSLESLQAIIPASEAKG
jgi:asparaginyl-tRNA synthetase